MCSKLPDLNTFNTTKLAAIALLSFILQSCQTVARVTAQEQVQTLTWEVYNDWDYAGRVVPPELLEQVQGDMFAMDWVGDPRRFNANKVGGLGQKTLYFVQPIVLCAEEEAGEYCGIKPSSPERAVELETLFYPECDNRGGCNLYIYVKENGKYHQVFLQTFHQQRVNNFLKVSEQITDGVPTCFELLGFDRLRYSEGKVPDRTDEQLNVSRYCYDGETYQFERVYLIPAAET